jgi:D-amino-acid dehydrogenase
MQVVVIGGGVIGVSSAYFLADAGHEVVLLERHGNVAEQASFGNAGIIAPAYAIPWSLPGMSRRFLSYLFKNDVPLKFKSKLNPAQWNWINQWAKEGELQRFRTNYQRMQNLAQYSRAILRDLRHREQLDFEQTDGYLQLLRNERQVALMQPLLQIAAENGLSNAVLDADAVRELEPALADHTPFAGALYYPDEATGNCALFTKQMKQAAQAMGVSFHFGAEVKAISARERKIGLQVEDREYTADAVVVAAGVESAPLLAPLNIQIPLVAVKGYTATATIKDFEQAPRSAILDEESKISLVRMGNRIRISGLAELGAKSMELEDAAVSDLIKVAEDWFPNAANYASAQLWSGARPMLPDGPPLVGATSIKNVYVNIGHGPTGWAMAAGSAKLLADIVSGKTPDLDASGYDLARYQR